MIKITIKFKQFMSPLIIDTDLSEQQFWANYANALSLERKVIIPSKDGQQYMINPKEIVYLTVKDLEDILVMVDESYAKDDKDDFC